MIGFLKKYKFALLAAVVIAAVLVIAFISGGTQPSVSAPQQTTAATHPTATGETSAPSVAPSAQTESKAPDTQAPSTALSTTSPQAATTPSASPASSRVQSSETAQPQAATSAANAPKEHEQPVTEQATSAPPRPVDTEEQTVKPIERRCTVSISCATLLAHRGEWSEELAQAVPQDGVILAPAKVTFQEGENAFDVLQSVCRSRQIHMEYTSTPLYHSAYIEGIANIYEFDCGSGSGWMYRVNGWFPNYGCSRYVVQNGDLIEWLYTCDLGRDIGGENIEYTE